MCIHLLVFLLYLHEVCILIVDVFVNVSLHNITIIMFTYRKSNCMSMELCCR